MLFAFAGAHRMRNRNTRLPTGVDHHNRSAKTEF
jgi:hypothetical protein